jgi:hypothetical protein
LSGEISKNRGNPRPLVSELVSPTLILLCQLALLFTAVL